MITETREQVLMPPQDETISQAAEDQLSTPTPGEEFGSGGETQAAEATQAVAEPTPAASGQESQDQLLSVSDAVRKLNLGLPDDVLSQGDYATLQALAERARQAEVLQRQLQQQDFYARLGQRVAPHADKLQQYFQQAEQPKQPERQPWQPPTDPASIERYMQFVERDQNTGVFVAKAGIDPAIAKAVNDYQDWVSGFLRDPGAVIEKAAQHISQKTFDERFEQRYQEIQRQQQVTQILQQNSSWLYQRGPDGSVMRSQSGAPALTPNGAAYVNALNKLSSMGVEDPVAKNDLAIKMVQADLYAQQLAQSQRQQQVAPAQRQALAGTQASQNPLQSLSAQARAETPAATEPGIEGLSFMEAARQAMKLEGINDDAFTPEAFSG